MPQDEIGGLQCPCGLLGECTCDVIVLTLGERQGRLAIVLASGRFCPGDMANDAMALRLGATRILAKPFTRTDLWAALGLSPKH